MSSTTKNPSKCDCLNWCGDDPWLKDGRANPCEKLIQQQEQELQCALETVRVNLIMQQYGVTTVYDLIEHLHGIVEALRPSDISGVASPLPDDGFDHAPHLGLRCVALELREMAAHLRDFGNSPYSGAQLVAGLELHADTVDKEVAALNGAAS